MNRHSILCHLPLALCLLTFSACTKQASPPPKPFLAFVANRGSNTVAVVDLAESRVIASIPVAGEPEQVVAPPGRREVWVVSKSGELTVIGAPDLKVKESLAAAKSGGDLFFSPDGSRFVLATDAGTVVFGNAPEGRRPAVDGSLDQAVYRYGGGCLTDDGKTLILSDAARDLLVFIDVPSRRVIGSVKVGKQPGPIVALPGGHKAFVADTGEDAVSAVDVAKQELLSNLEISSSPVSLALKHDGGELFVLGEGGVMTIIDAFHDDVEQPFPVGQSPATGVFRKDSSVLYVASAADGSVTAIDVQNRVVLNSTEVGGNPQSLALTPDERFLVVAVPASSGIAVLRADPSMLTTQDSALVTTVPTGLNPVDVVVPGELSR